MRRMMCALLGLAVCCPWAGAQGDPRAPGSRPGVPVRAPSPPLAETTFRVLVFTRTMNFRHDSIQAGVEALSVMGTNQGFSVDWTEDPGRFTPEHLAEFGVVVFLNTTGDVLGPEQEAAFEAYIRGGGGYVGVHAASDTEYEWPFYKELVGAYFKSHPAVQQAEVEFSERHGAELGWSGAWTHVDEWYDFTSVPGEEFEVLASLDPSSYEGSTMSGPHPIAWRREIDKGRAAYTAMGHVPRAFSEPLFTKHLGSLITWAKGTPIPAEPQGRQGVGAGEPAFASGAMTAMQP
ncbi:MAG: ThuA domain-containing protein [Phycisphaerales bacterium]|nr:ThuA domain-containing protein [Phycisphaerales bacterium]